MRAESRSKGYMFTGIVEEIGELVSVKSIRAGKHITIKAQKIHADTKIGDSIAVNGACLTVTDIKNNLISFDVIHETLDKTTLGSLKNGDEVNLERSMKFDSRFGGHFVTGHIDYKGKIIGIINNTQGVGFKISLPAEFSKFLVQKGSVTVDGVSLTVAEVSREDFTVYLIPYTLKVTAFGKKKKGDFVNIETDILGKYIAKKPDDTTLENILKKYNYIN